MAPFTMLEFDALVSAALRISDECLTLEAAPPPNAADRRLSLSQTAVPEKGLCISFPSTPSSSSSPTPHSPATATTMLSRFKRHASMVFGAHNHSQSQARTQSPTHHLPIPIINISDAYKLSCDTASAHTASTDDFIPYLPLASQYELNATLSSPPPPPTASSAASLSSLSSSSSSLSSNSSVDDPFSPTTPNSPSFPIHIVPPTDADADTDPFVKLPVQIIPKHPPRPRRRPSLRPPPPSPPPAGPLPRPPVEWTLGLGVPRCSAPVVLPPRPVSPSPLPKNKRATAPAALSTPAPAPRCALPLFEPQIQRPVLRMKSMPDALAREDWTLSLPVHLSTSTCPSAFLAPRAGAGRSARVSLPVPPVRARTQSHPHTHRHTHHEATSSTLAEPSLARPRTHSTRSARISPPLSPPPTSPPPAAPLQQHPHARAATPKRPVMHVDSGFWDAEEDITGFESGDTSVYETARSSQSSFLEI